MDSLNCIKNPKHSDSDLESPLHFYGVVAELVAVSIFVHHDLHVLEMFLSCCFDGIYIFVLFWARIIGGNYAPTNNCCFQVFPLNVYDCEFVIYP